MIGHSGQAAASALRWTTLAIERNIDLALESGLRFHSVSPMDAQQQTQEPGPLTGNPRDPRWP